MLRSFPGALALLMVTAAAWAQEPCDREIDVSMRSSQFPGVGVRIGGPLRVGAYYYRYRPAGRNTPCEQNLWTSTFDVGIGGAQVSLGRQRGKGGYGRFLPIRGQVTLLQTFGDPLVARRNRTYAGVEAQAQMFWGVRAGWYQPLLRHAETVRFGAISVVVGF